MSNRCITMSSYGLCVSEEMLNKSWGLHVRIWGDVKHLHTTRLRESNSVCMTPEYRVKKMSFRYGFFLVFGSFKAFEKNENSNVKKNFRCPIFRPKAIVRPMSSLLARSSTLSFREIQLVQCYSNCSIENKEIIFLRCCSEHFHNRYFLQCWSHCCLYYLVQV